MERGAGMSPVVTKFLESRSTMAEETRTPTAHAGSSGGESRPERSGGDRPERSGPRGPRPGGGPGGPREGGRKYFQRKKGCKFCVEKIEAVNYKDVRPLAQGRAGNGQITPRQVARGVEAH